MSDRYIVQSDLVGFRPSEIEDLPLVIRIERDETNTPFIGGWRENVHRKAIETSNSAHWIIEKLPEETPIGYVILPEIENVQNSIELKRIVIGEKGAGYGRAAIKLLKRVVFEDWGKHRLWLDVMEHNARARYLYSSEGFIEEGVWRDAFYRDGVYVSLVFMSMLEHEYKRP